MNTLTLQQPLQTIQLEIPKCDMAFLKKLAAKMGWSIPNKKRMSSLERALEDIEKGRVTTYNSTEEFYKEMGI